MTAKWTDLALEARGETSADAQQLEGGIERTVVKIEDEFMARELMRPAGTYVTLSCPQMMTIELATREALSRELARTIREMLPAGAKTAIHADKIIAAFDWLPLFSIGMSWVVPALVGLAIGLALHYKNKKSA